MKIKLFVLILALSFSLLTCDHGIGPSNIKLKTGISGTIYYSNWAAADSIYLLKAVFFKTFPPISISAEILSGNAPIYPVALAEGLPVNVLSTPYEIVLEPDTIKYISVAQQYGPNVLADWRSVGQYNIVPADSLPDSVIVYPDSMLQNIDIFVDFNDLPIQPF